MAEMNYSPERGYTVTLTDTEYDALKVKALERDALAADLARCRAANVYDAEAHRKAALVENLEAALREGYRYVGMVRSNDIAGDDPIFGWLTDTKALLASESKPRCSICSQAVNVLRRYLPPDGISVTQAMQEIVDIFDSPAETSAQRFSVDSPKGD